MTQKTILITGATSGIGTETACQLAQQGHNIVIAARNEGKARKTVSTICEIAKHDRVDYLIVDFSSQASIRQMADQFLENYNQLHVLINNHGTVNILRNETVDGLEETFAVNHLGYFLLTNLLLERIKESGTVENPARIINVSSSSHHDGRLDFDNLQLHREYSWKRAYGNSKLANILFTKVLAEQLEKEKAPVVTNALHPGWVATGIGADAIPIPLIGRIGKWFINLTAMSPQKGAQTSVYLASDPEAANFSGEYFYNSKPYKTSAAAKDMQVAHRLWDISAELVGLS